MTLTTLLAVFIVAITACGSPAPSSSASSHGTAAASSDGSTLSIPGNPCPVPAPASRAAGDPLAGLTVARIRAKAGADAEAMRSVCLSVRQPMPGTRLKGLATITVASLSAPNCEFTATTPGGGSATLLEIRKVLWVWANQAYARIAGAQTAEALSARTGKWVRAPRMDYTIDDLLPLCRAPWLSFSNLTFPDKNPSFPETRIAGLPVIDGQQTVGITDPLGGITYVSDTARPLPVRDTIKVQPGVTYNYDYFDFGIPATITPPPPADVIDGSGYGS